MRVLRLGEKFEVGCVDIFFSFFSFIVGWLVCRRDGIKCDRM